MSWPLMPLARLYFIHALREEGDLGGVEEPSSSATISIHALREEGDERRLKRKFYSLILSTPSARRATEEPRPVGRPVAILSTPSARRATNVLGALYGANQFIHASARRATN